MSTYAMQIVMALDSLMIEDYMIDQKNKTNKTYAPLFFGSVFFYIKTI